MRFVQNWEKQNVKVTHTPHPVDIYVGKRLRLRRTILGLSQESVAKAIGITFQQIQKYERGVNRMSASRLHDFAKVMSVPINYFFEGFDESAGTKGTPEQVASGMEESAAAPFDYGQMSSRETLEMMRNYYRIEQPTVRRKIAELIKATADGLLITDEKN
jgi:transcriptional regulator with XRE-family HTH domain